VSCGSLDVRLIGNRARGIERSGSRASTSAPTTNNAHRGSRPARVSLSRDARQPCSPARAVEATKPVLFGFARTAFRCTRAIGYSAAADASSSVKTRRSATRSGGPPPGALPASTYPMGARSRRTTSKWRGLAISTSGNGRRGCDSRVSPLWDLTTTTSRQLSVISAVARGPRTSTTMGMGGADPGTGMNGDGRATWLASRLGLPGACAVRRFRMRRPLRPPIGAGPARALPASTCYTTQGGVQA